MNKLRKTINHIPLLTPARGGAFERGIAAARTENDHHPTKHILHERIVFSLLAFRARIGLGASAREIARETGLHPKTVKNTLSNLSDLAHEHDGRWFANEPPDGWFKTAALKKADHWSQRFAYSWLFLPRKGAKFLVGDRSRRFSLNHAAVFSCLVSFSDKNNIVRNLTILGLSTMLHGMNRKTVKAIIDDLGDLGLIERLDFGARLAIRLLPMKDEHFELFAPPSRSPEVQHDPSTTPQRPASNSYEYKQDGYDEYRRICESFMSQAYAERAIRAVRVLGVDIIDFQITLENSKNQSEHNVRNGKCPVENFGRFFVTPLEEKMKAIEKREREDETEDRRREYLNSPEGKRTEAERKLAAAADPLHNFHTVTTESLTDRVKFDDNPMQNYREAERCCDRVRRHCRAFIDTKGWLHQKTVDESGNLFNRIMGQGLSKINRYYQQPVLATPDELRTAIDEAIMETEPAMTPLFEEVACAK
jgi:hypothetical protein